MGELVTEKLDYDGGRAVTVYVPAEPAVAIVFAGDGQLVAAWGADAALPTMVVGTHRLDDEMARLHEYTPVFDADRFAAHERFFVTDVRGWVQERFGVSLPRERTAVAGVSAGAELSLAIGLRHPALYGTVFAASPGGGFRPDASLPTTRPRIYLTAGNCEPFFLDNAQRWADALARDGADHVMRVRDGDHGDPFWREEFLRMIEWAFGNSRACT